uniref:Uncharacterized protein n=1 Tax=Caenorhabditis japonica TaxID=281687 RepID=A0A8R1I6A4_CAEJA
MNSSRRSSGLQQCDNIFHVAGHYKRSSFAHSHALRHPTPGFYTATARMIYDDFRSSNRDSTSRSRTGNGYYSLVDSCQINSHSTLNPVPCPTLGHQPYSVGT